MCHAGELKSIEPDLSSIGLPFVLNVETSFSLNYEADKCSCVEGIDRSTMIVHDQVVPIITEITKEEKRKEKNH